MSASEPVFMMYWWEWVVDFGILFGILFVVIVSFIGFFSSLQDVDEAGENARKQMKEKEKRP